MISTYGYSDDMTLGEIKQAEQDKAEAADRKRALERAHQEARWYEEDVPVAEEYGLSVSQAWNLFYDMLSRYEDRYC